MRIAGIFSQLALAFVATSLTLTAFATAQSADQPAPATPAAQAGSEPAPAVANLPASPALSRWAVPALADNPTAAPSAPPVPPVEPDQRSTLAATPPVAPAVDVPPVAEVPPRPSPIVAPLAARAPEPEAAPAAPSAPSALRSALTSAASAIAATFITPNPAAPIPADTVEPQTGGTPGLRPAKALFGAVTSPAPLAARAIGTYAKGCLAGGQALPVDGPAWQAMRLSRNRNWGHPRLISLIEKLAIDGRAKDSWPGLLVGDIAQPRGGPMLTGHASHQIGLDADIWLTPMPDRTLTAKERETIEATSMLGEDGVTVNRDVWTEGHLKILKRAASYPDVERIFVHPAIKQVLCFAAGEDRAWLTKVRPYWGHFYHFHVRIHCPPGSANCTPQKSVPGDDGCGKELDDWLKLAANVKPEPEPLPIPPVVAAKPPKEKPAMTLDQLPSECRVVLANGNPQLLRDIAAAAKAAEVAKEAAAKPAAKPAVAAKSAAITPAPAKPPAAPTAATGPADTAPMGNKKTTTQ